MGFQASIDFSKIKNINELIDHIANLEMKPFEDKDPEMRFKSETSNMTLAKETLVEEEKRMKKQYNEDVKYLNEFNKNKSNFEPVYDHATMKKSISELETILKKKDDKKAEIATQPSKSKPGTKGAKTKEFSKENVFTGNRRQESALVDPQG